MITTIIRKPGQQYRLSKGGVRLWRGFKGFSMKILQCSVFAVSRASMVASS